MKYDHFSMLPERAFQPRGGRFGMTLEGGGSGGGGGQTSSTVTQTNIPEYARPYVESMLGATMKELFTTKEIPGTTTPAKYDPETGMQISPETTTPAGYEITGVKPFEPFSRKAEDYFAQFTPEQQRIFSETAGMQTPGQFGQGAGMAGIAGQGALDTTGMGYMYGGQGADIGQRAAGMARQAASYGRGAADIGQQGADVAGMGFGAGQRYEQMATSPGAMQAYMSPYMQNVVDVQKQQAIRDYQENVAPQLAAQATRSGAFGGSRAALQKGVAERGLAQQLQNIQAQGTQQAFQQAQQAQQYGADLGLRGLGAGLQGLQTGISGQQAGMQGVQGALAGTSQALQGAQLGLQGVGAAQAGYGMAGQQAANLANIGAQQQAADIARLGFQGQTAAQQRQREQDVLNQQIQNYAMQQEFPRQQLSFMNAMLRGLPMQSTTTQGYMAPPSNLAQLGSLASIGYGVSKIKKGGHIKSMSDGGIAAISRKVLMNPEKYSPSTIKQGMASGSVNPVIGNIAMTENADFARRAAAGIDSLPVSNEMFSAAGGGIVAFAGEDGSQVEDVISRETREIEQGTRTDYSPAAKSVLAQQSAANKQAQANYLQREQQRMLAGNPMMSSFRPAASAPAAALTSPAAIQAAAYPDESKRGTASMTRPGGISGIDLKTPPPSIKEAAPAAAAATSIAKEAASKEAAPKEAPATPESEFAKYKQLLKEAGVSEDIFKTDREATKAMREKLAAREKEASGLAFIEAGLKGLGARSVGEMAEKMAPSVGTYARSKKELAAEERELAGIDRDMNKAEDALRRGDVKTYMEFKDKAEQRAIQLRDVEAREKYYSKPTGYEQVRSDLMSGDPKRVAAAQGYLGQGKTGAVTEDDIYRRWGELQKDPARMLELKKQGITSYEQFRAQQLGAIRGVGGAGWGIREIK